ncbi:MAG TPA: beta-ketoacyl-ACP synthase II [Blastocatellia bacterium]|jgi:3-oxoacyl-[acyl-carrier-protein] synthase II|nr:beta-ketoacyl-ACP synthase II [Blastocatellia bacterium]
MKRIAVTGIGVIAPTGVGRERVWEALVEGRSGISRIDDFDTSNLKTNIAGVCRDFRPEEMFDEREMSRLDRVSQLAIAATEMATREAGLTNGQLDSYDAGVFLGTGFGGQGSIEEFCGAFFSNGKGRRSAIAIPKSMYNASSSNIAIRFKTRGPNITVTTACSSGANAIGQAFHLIQHGHAERMIAGGVDAPITPVVMDAWKEMRVLSTKNEPPERACKPFSANRDGFVLSEGAGIVVLEDLEMAAARGAHIYAEVIGYGSTADASHITFPDPDGESHAMTRAMKDAGVNPNEIDYINAHGTATKLNDASETEAIKRVFGSRAHEIPCSSIKSMLGHSMGAAGAIEFIATVLAIENQVIPPTTNYEEADPQCDLDYVTEGSRRVSSSTPLRTAISNSFGFGGNNAVLVVRAYVQ